MCLWGDGDCVLLLTYPAPFNLSVKTSPCAISNGMVGARINHFATYVLNLNLQNVPQRCRELPGREKKTKPNLLKRQEQQELKLLS
ncbi:hypothetical protein LEMLEM_LOCUS20582 [Lemmus lemmus]